MEKMTEDEIVQRVPAMERHALIAELAKIPDGVPIRITRIDGMKFEGEYCNYSLHKQEVYYTLPPNDPTATGFSLIAGIEEYLPPAHEEPLPPVHDSPPLNE